MIYSIDIEKAFLEMIRENERLIYKVCSFYASDEYPLADLYQEVVCNLWTGYPKFRNISSEKPGRIFNFQLFLLCLLRSFSSRSILRMRI